ncbi:MAG: NfeD family protein [Bacteroidales bacterium]|nr:NfeD family protein [Bacteroidales bacterium]MCM1148219.1 NfeD family protein [Bacteroidales bacterium]MCM1206950.1 NfeD family protein [Bacillota bacterium]MCM1511204.1 NfeD family protein [Clostridium sp.]
MIDFVIGNVPFDWALWIVVAVAFLIIEMLTGTLYVFCFACGAVLSFLVSFFTGSFSVQLLAFAFATAMSIFLIRPMMKKYLHPKEMEKVSNADAVIGKEGRVSEHIPGIGYGRVAIDGDDWKAQSQNGQPIPVDSRVKVVSRDSIIITVTAL